MKKVDLEKGIEDLKEVRDISSKLDYNTSVAINQKLIKIIPLLESELSRMNRDNINVDSPVYMEITQKDCEDLHKSMQEYINDTLANLSDNDIIIIDYGIKYIDSNTKVGYIKYNRK